MTLCVGLVENGRCIIGADSLVCDDNEQQWSVIEPKCFDWGGILIADAGPMRPSQVLRRQGFDVPQEDGEALIYALPAVLKRALKGVYSSKAERNGHEILVGYCGKLAVIYPETWEIVWPSGPVAIGHPPAIAAARGAMHASASLLGVDARSRIETALEAGALVSPYVSGPWHFVSE